jgi:hypothetical protein
LHNKVVKSHRHGLPERVIRVVLIQLPVDPNGQAFARELVDDIEHAELAPVMGAVLDEVVTPDVVGILRPQPDARAIVEPEPPFLGLLLRHFQPLPPPDRLDPLRYEEGIDIGGEPWRVLGLADEVSVEGSLKPLNE